MNTYLVKLRPLASRYRLFWRERHIELAKEAGAEILNHGNSPDSFWIKAFEPSVIALLNDVDVLSVKKAIQCLYCGEEVVLQPDGTITPHYDFYPQRYCEGGNRLPGYTGRRPAAEKS